LAYPERGKFPIAVPEDEDLVKAVEKFFDRELAGCNYADFDPCVVFFFTMTTRQA